MTPAKRSTSSTGSEGSRGKNGAEWSQMWGRGLQIGPLEGPTGCLRDQNGTLRSQNGTQICSLGAQRGPQGNQTKPQSPQVCQQGPEGNFWLDLGDPKWSQNGAKSGTKMDLNSAPLPKRFRDLNLMHFRGAKNGQFSDGQAEGTARQRKSALVRKHYKNQLKNTCFPYGKTPMEDKKEWKWGKKKV